MLLILATAYKSEQELNLLRVRIAYILADGWLLNLVFDGNTERSFIQIVDAQAVEQGRSVQKDGCSC